MTRVDLLALTPEDLASITNRGTVKRAQKEIEDGTLTCVIRDSDQELVFEWSDGTVCRFPSGKTIHDAVCSSGVLGVSRHVVRSVLAYQLQRTVPPAATAADPPDTTDVPGAASATVAAPGTDWDPGLISDEDLIQHFRAPVIARARQRFQQGTLVELIRGPKPLARFLDEPCTLRFMVPGDVRYVSANCSEAMFGTFVPMAVWSFRELDASRRSGLVAHQQTGLQVPTPVLEGIQTHLRTLVTDGIQGVSTTWPQQLLRHEAACRENGLIWPADLLAELHHQQEMYSTHDALFDPQAVVRLAGELLVRIRAIAAQTTAVPQVLIRGSRLERTTDLVASRLIGLGCGVTRGRRSVTLTAFLQDTDAGGVMGVERSFADPQEDSSESPKDYSELGQITLSRGISLSAIGSGQLLTKSGKLTPAGRLVLPRTTASLSLTPQGFSWEHLKPPLAVEGLAELGARLDLLPPSCLRARRLTETLCVCPLETVESVNFDVAAQRLDAFFLDRTGDRARISLPFTTRGQAGFERLSAALVDTSLRLRFVCGHVSRRKSGIQIEPIAVVFEDRDGRRRSVQPWVDSRGDDTSSAAASEHRDADRSPLSVVLEEIAFELSELILNGLRRTDSAGRWERLSSRAAHVGLVRLSDRIREMSRLLNQQAEQARWDPTPAAEQLLNLLLISRVADDLPAE